MITLDQLRAWGADIEDALPRCLNNEAFYLRLVGKAVQEPAFDRLREALETGDIGLFFLDGLTYIKKYVVNNAGTFLVSLNAKYKPLEVGEFSTFKIFGKLAVD